MAEDRFVDDFEKVHGPYLLGELTAEEQRELERQRAGAPPGGLLSSPERAGEGAVDQRATSGSGIPSPVTESQGPGAKASRRWAPPRE